MKKMIAVLAAILFVAGNMNAQVADLEFLSSPDKLLSYALKRVNNVQGGVYSESMRWSDNISPQFYAQWTGGNDALALSKFVAGQLLSYSVDSPKDSMQVNAWYCGKDGSSLFSGYVYLSFTQGPDGKWVLPDKIPLEMKLNRFIRVEIPNMIGARVVLRDRFGNRIGNMSLEVWDGAMWWQKEYSQEGAYGEIVLTFRVNDGVKTVSYSRANGAPIVPTVGSTSLAVSTDGVETYQDGDVTTCVQSYNGYGVSPLVQLRLTERTTVTITAFTSEGENASSVVVSDAKTGKVVTCFDTRTGQPVGEMKDGVVQTCLDSGFYELHYTWPTLRDPNQSSSGSGGYSEK